MTEVERNIIALEVFEDKVKKKQEKLVTKKGRDNAHKTVAYEAFNWNSHRQVGKLLYEQLGLPVRRTKKGGYATDAATLEKLAGKHPVTGLYSQRNSYSNYLSNFIDGVIERQIDGRIYPEFNVSGTVTRRLSHSNPNLGNQPSRGEWRKIREIYRPDPGYHFAKADYSQLEICIAAHYSGDKSLLKIVYEGASQHDITAEGVGIPRDKAKTLNFAILYGCTVYKVMEILGCSEKAAEEALAKYWETYSGLKVFIDWAQSQVAAQRPLTNMFGGQRAFPRATGWALERQLRQAFNFFTQSTGGELTNAAYYWTDEILREKGIGHCVLSVHDEILLSAKEAHCEEALHVLEWVMVEVGRQIKLRVPLSVEGEFGLDRWQK